MEIKNHRLIGNNVVYRETPNKGGNLLHRYLVFHYTAGRSAESSIEHLCNPDARASAHVVIARDGGITQLAPFDIKTWHAGVSHWNGLSGLNSFSIGIEMGNAGPLSKSGKHYSAWFGGDYSEDEVLHAKHKHEGIERYWHTYTEKQIESAVDLAGLLVKQYGLEDVLGHEDIARGRKTDPGPAFPMESIRGRIMGRADDEQGHYRVMASSLNVRSGPGAEFEKIAPALKQGTKVLLIEAGDRWNRVEVPGTRDIEGWVRNTCIERIPPGWEK